VTPNSFRHQFVVAPFCEDLFRDTFVRDTTKGHRL